MARDYFSIPVTGVPSVRLFSRAGDVITKKKNGLIDCTTTAILLVQNWTALPEIEQWVLDEEEQAEDGGWQETSKIGPWAGPEMETVEPLAACWNGWSRLGLSR